MPSVPAPQPPRRALPAAVSVLTAAVVGGDVVAATVLGVHGPALYLDVAGRVVPVVTSDAVPLPTAVRLTVARDRVDWGVHAGEVVEVGSGRVRLPALDVVAARTWRPARVRRTTASAACAVTVLRGFATLLRDGGGPGAGADADRGWLADGIRALFPAVVGPGGRPGTLPGARPVDDGVAALLGRGRGLTPSGDDALAGALLVAHALGTATPLATAVRARLGATTAVSAALLDAAADGFAARPVVALVDAVLAGDRVTVAAVLPTVIAIGHSSGGDLVTGVATALESLAPTVGARTLPHPTPTTRSAA